MTKKLTIIMLFLSSVCFAQQIEIFGFLPQPESVQLYRIQVGSYRETANAQNAFDRLAAAGLNPIYENYLEYKRVVVTGIIANRVSNVMNLIRNAGFSEIWIREERPVSNFTIVTNGNGTVDVINETNDNTPLLIVQTIPSFDSVEDNYYPSNAPVIFFFNDKLYIHSIEENISLTSDGNPINGTIVISEGANSFAVLTLTPNDPLPAGKNVSVLVGNQIQDGSGNRMLSDVNISFVTVLGSETNFNPDNYGFEAGRSGVYFTGDGDIDSTKGDLVPFEGNYYAAISTGEQIVSKDASAIGSTSSQILLGPIQQSFSTLAFHYNFISAEFNEYVGSKYDDNAMVTILGPSGSHTEIITSVNKVRFNNFRFSNYPRMPDEGDSYAGQTGWLRHKIDNINVGYPAYIIFTVTDVSDDIYSSILAIDAIELQ